MEHPVHSKKTQDSKDVIIDITLKSKTSIFGIIISIFEWRDWELIVLNIEFIILSVINIFFSFGWFTKVIILSMNDLSWIITFTPSSKEYSFINVNTAKIVSSEYLL